MSPLLAHVRKLAWLNQAQKRKTQSKGAKVKVLFVGRGEKVPAAFYKSAPSSIKAQIKKKTSMVKWSSSTAENWLFQMQVVEPQNHYGRFTPSPYSMARDLVGTGFKQIFNESPQSITVDHIGQSDEEFLGLCVGMELAHYQFKKVWPQPKTYQGGFRLNTRLKKSAHLLNEGSLLGEAVNFSRFLVDLPPNLLQPQDYAELLRDLFAKKPKTKVTLWNQQRLEKEEMGLHVAVGQAASQEPHMVHIQYRGGGQEKPLAFVGKGVTFDAGGLDIKPAANMRLMKKDMGGSASVAGLAYWVIHSKAQINCDFYFAIAENSVGEKSFRPGDVLTARNGLTVEIHNTDAEGRLVLADCLTVASQNKPQLIVDVATLTGAIKHALGAYTPGLFSNSDNLAEALLSSGQERGDVAWRMPLVPEEKSRLRSDVADVVNCTNGFGGAVTAALFLEMFVGDIPWAHFDIYSWLDSPKGPFASAGGSGQIVQALSHFVETQIQNQNPSV